MMTKQLIMFLAAGVLAWGMATEGQGAVPVRCPAVTAGTDAWRAFSEQRNLTFTAVESGLIWNYLETGAGDDAEKAAIKNNLLDQLVEQEPLPKDLGDGLLRLYRNRDLTVVVRDFTLQHFAPYLRRVLANGTARVDPAATRLLAELRDAVRNGEGMAGASALLGLESLISTSGPVTAAHVGGEAVRLATDSNRDPALRATALQVAMHLERRDVLPAARAAVQPGQPLVLRLSGVNCLGTLGDTSDAAQLKQVGDADAVRRVAVAARRALDGREVAKRTRRAPSGSDLPNVEGKD